MDYPTIDEQVSMWRKHLGLSQAQLEEAASLGHNTISRIERGLHHPQLSTINKIARAMKISPEQLQFVKPSVDIHPVDVESYKNRITLAIEELSEDECREIYPIVRNLLEVLKRRERD